MTNSEKQTKRSKGGADKSDAMPAYATGDFWTKAFAKNPALVAGIVFLLVGWAFILQINRWHFTVPVFMLWMGWVGVLATVRFLWFAGIAMASATESHDVLDVSGARLRELLGEKKALLRAIKEIEFDRDLGKMSPEDAKEIMRFYRARAIEVIKEIDGQRDSELTVAQRIERDLQARLAIDTKLAPKVKKKVPVAESDETEKVAAKSDEPVAKSDETEKVAAKETDADESANESEAVEAKDASVESA